MLSVVHSSDCPKLEFIQPHPNFVNRDGYGRISHGPMRDALK
jgi:hypothetical protein